MLDLNWFGAHQNGMMDRRMEKKQSGGQIADWWTEECLSGPKNVMNDRQKNDKRDNRMVVWTEGWFGPHQNGMMDRRMVSWI